jgi:hypothetical protein
MNSFREIPSFLPLGATAQGEFWPPEQSASILLYSSSFLPILSHSFYGDHIHPPTISTWVFLCSFADVDFRTIHPSEADCPVSEQYSVYGMRLASRPTFNLEDQGIPFRLAPTP